MKEQPLLGRFKDKGYYDVYAITGFHDGEPKKAADRLNKSLKKQKIEINHPLIFSGLQKIINRFEKGASVDPAMVSRFMDDEMLTIDAFERVTPSL